LARAEREAEHVGWPDALAILAFCKAELARWSGDFAEARRELARAQALMQNISVDPVFRVMILDSLAHLDAAEDDLETAGSRRAEALPLALDSMDLDLASQVLLGVADHAVRRGRPLEAARLLAASECVGGGRDESRPDGARVEAAVRELLDESEFSAAMRRARDEFSSARGEPATAAGAARELAMSVLAPMTSAPGAD
jgi:hypothetical protein